MKLILEAIKALFRKVENRIEDLRKSIPVVAPANWLQNDRTKPDYVKNRTHYEEVEQESIEGLEFGLINDFTIPFELGQSWNMYHSSTQTGTYRKLSNYLSDDGSFPVQQAEDGTLYIGTPELNNAPFYITENAVTLNSSFKNMYQVYYVKIVGVSGTRTITNIKKLDAKYLPDGIPNEEQIAEAMKKASDPCLILETNSEYYDFANSTSTSLLGKVRIASGSFSAVIQQIADGKDPIVIFRGGVSTYYNGRTWEMKFCLKSKAVYYNKSNLVILYFELETMPSDPSTGKNLQIIIRGESSSIVNAEFIQK